MSATLQWDNPQQTVVRIEIPSDWDWSDITDARYRFREMSQAVPHRVDLIIDVSQSHFLHKNALSNLRHFSYHKAAKTGLIILVGANPFFRSIAQLFHKITPDAALKFSFADSLEEARTLLAELDLRPGDFSPLS